MCFLWESKASIYWIAAVSRDVYFDVSRYISILPTSVVMIWSVKREILDRFDGIALCVTNI